MISWLKEYLNIQMEIYMKVSLIKMGISVVKEFISIFKMINIKESLLITKSMGME